MAIADLRGLIAEQSLTFLAEIPYVYHCHHYNLFHDQTIDDALGEVEGARVRTVAAHNAFRELLGAIFEKAEATTPAERISLATEVFSWMGQGKISLDVTATGGRARSASLHYGYAWREKYGSRVKRAEPADAVAAGFASAATELAFGLAWDGISASEHKCLATRDAECEFKLETTTSQTASPPIDEATTRRYMVPAIRGVDEDRISQIGAGLIEFMRGVAGDERGLVAAFNVFVTAHLPSYYNETVYEAVHRVERTQSGSVPAIEALMREAGQVCVFNTFGNVLLSPEWEGLVGPLSGVATDTMSFCTAIARGLGFGHWLVGSYEPRKRLVLKATSNYEVPFYRSRYGLAKKPRSYFVQGAALAMMCLAETVKWTEKPQLTNDYYIELFRGKPRYRVEQTKCMMRGDSISEYVVDAL
ncbi:MAG TPA: hypothetical protein VH165_33020 [Kofleriaceae bacterium]|jgi:hypothetical protein|nr:hypothetical protein [Kofleriaceae bacterium]